MIKPAWASACAGAFFVLGETVPFVSRKLPARDMSRFDRKWDNSSEEKRPQPSDHERSEIMEYASKAVGTAGLTLGIIGTSLGALAGAGGLAGILGVRPGGPQGGDPGDRPVTRYEMSLISENQQLKAQQYTDMRANGLQQQIGQQAVWNATQEGVLRCQAQQLAQLYSLTQLTIPNGNVSPGWGPVNVFPAPPAVPVVPGADVTFTEKAKIKT